TLLSVLFISLFLIVCSTDPPTTFLALPPRLLKPNTHPIRLYIMTFVSLSCVLGFTFSGTTARVV
ncbi:hypothetical protein B0H16DRAFT_1543882, partial [Mycena metata]